ncbi:MAG: glycosyltransferase family 39 protein, partial [Deltaproteobacteria bacterium]|nr:glycosyltransferase family 39 protein [Deltaproteobacteria bacterium]
MAKSSERCSPPPGGMGDLDSLSARGIQSKSFGARLLVQAQGVFLIAAGFLIILAPSAPFTKELGVCESGAVRDVLAGNIILPRFVPGPIVHVPPLYWWMAAICVKALGWSELALRLPSLIAAALTCAIVFAWSSRTLGPSVGLWSAAALLLCHFFLDAARQPRMDSMLALFVTAAAVSLERAIAARAQAKPHATWYFIAAAIAIGLGTLTKGILGIVLPGLVVALFLLIRGRLAELFHFDMAATFAVGLAIGLAWFLAGYELGGRPFLEWQVRMNLWSRFIPAGAGGAGYCAHPFWYFAPQILSGFLPWSLYLPAFALAAWPAEGRRLPEPAVYALCWFAALFIFFSSSHGKCLIYILPAFPPLAILTGWAIVQVQRGFDTRRWVRQLFKAGSAIIAIGTALMVIAAMLVIGYGMPAKIALRLHPTDHRFLELLVRQAFNPPLLLWAGFSLMGAALAVRGLLRAIPALEIYGTLMIAAA